MLSFKNTKNNLFSRAISFALILAVFVIQIPVDVALGFSFPLVGKSDDLYPGKIEVVTMSDDSESTKLEWHNTQGLWSREVGKKASILDFNTQNSAYLTFLKQETKQEAQSVSGVVGEEANSLETETEVVGEQISNEQEDDKQQIILDKEEAPSEEILEENEEVVDGATDETQEEVIIEPADYVQPEEVVPEVLIPENDNSIIEESVSFFKKFLPIAHAEEENIFLNSEYLEFSDFSFDNSKFSTSTISGAELKISLAGVVVQDTTLLVEYSKDGSAWGTLEEIEVNKDREVLAGTKSLTLPKELIDSVGQLKIRISYKYPENLDTSEILLFIDSLWIQTFHSFINLNIPLNNEADDLQKMETEDGFYSLELNTPTSKMVVPGTLEQPFLFGEQSSLNEQLIISPIVENIQSVAKREGDFLIYEDVYPNTNLRYESTNNGLKEYIDLLDTEHPSEFKYSANLSYFDVVQVSNTEIDLYKKGKGKNDLFKLYTIKAPVMYDSAGNTSSDILLSFSEDVITVTPNAGWLSGATYPVVVDPIVEISVLNVHSHPLAGDIWAVDFTTSGTSDLYITPADQATIDEDEFVSLFCGQEDRTLGVQILSNDVIYYPDWSCDEVATVNHMTLVTGNHHLIFSFGGETSEAFNAAYVWDGGGGDAFWGTAANWSSDIVPNSFDTVTFNNTCVSNCNPIINADTAVSGITIASTYAGTITLNNTYTLTIGTNGFSQAGGTFTGGVATTSIGGAFTISGGTFNAASTTVFAGGTYNININSSQTFHNVSINGSVSAFKTLSAGDTLVILGDLNLIEGGVSLASYSSPGSLDVRGSINQSSTFDGGTAIIDFGNDSLAQTWTVSGGTGPVIRLNSASDANDSIVISSPATFYGATITPAFSGVIPISNSGNHDLTFGSTVTVPAWAQAAGTFNGSTGTTTFTDSTFTVSGGTFNAASTTVFAGGNHTLDVNTTQNFHNLTFNGTAATFKTISAGDTFVINGTLSLVEGGVHTASGVPASLEARAGVVQSSTFDGGTAIIDFGNDSLAQTWTVSGGTGPVIRLNSASDANDSIVISSPATFYGATITSSFSGIIPISNSGNHNLTFGVSDSADAWAQAAGTFNGGVGTTTFSTSDFTISGGTFNAASTTVFAGNNSNININSTLDFHDLIINATSITTKTISSGDTLIVNGTLYLTSGNVGTGIIKAKGNIIQASSMEGSTAVVDFDNDSLSQTWTVNGGTGPVLRLDSAADASDIVLINTGAGFYGATITSAFVGVIPISNPGNHNITFSTGGYSQAAGTFNGSTGTTTIAGNFTISGGVYNAATNTVMTGLSTNIDFSPSQEFYNFYFNQSNIAGKIIASGDTLIVLNNLFFNDGQVNSSGIIEARGDVFVAPNFDGANTALNFTGANNQNFNLTGATGSYNGDVTVTKTAGSVSLVSALVMDAASQDLRITAGTFDVNGNNLTINGTSGTLQASSTGVLKLQGAETFTLNSGNPLLATSSIVEYSGSSSYTIKDWNYGGITISGSGSFSTPNANEDVAGSFLQSAGTFTAPSGNLTVSKNFSRTGGTFSHNNGTVVFNGGNQTISGNTTFNNFTKSTSTTDILTFGAGQTQTILGNMTLSGAASNLLSLRSTISDTQWSIDPQGSRTINYLDVQDSNNTNGVSINAVGTNSVSRSNNTNWEFGESFTQSSYRWYQNIDSLSLSTPLSAQNSSSTLGSVSDPIRLRMNILVDGNDIPASSQSFKLQVSNLTSGGWQDIGSTSTVSFYNNPSLSSQTTLSSLLLTTSNATGTYEEANPSGLNPFDLIAGQFFEFDFSLNVSGLVEDINYFFRLVFSGGTVLDSYSNYAQLVYAPNQVPNSPSSLGPAGLVDGSWGTDSTPTLTFTLTDPDASDTVRYHILIDDSIDFSSPVVNSTSALSAQGSFSYTPSSLADGSYYWRVSSSDNSGAASATTTANSGSVAFRIDRTDPNTGTLSATSITSSSITLTVSGASDATSGLSAAPFIFTNVTTGATSGATSSTSWTLSSLGSGVTYRFNITVYDEAGNSATTPNIFVTTSLVSGGGAGGSGSSSGNNPGTSPTSNPAPSPAPVTPPPTPVVPASPAPISNPPPTPTQGGGETIVETAPSTPPSSGGSSSGSSNGSNNGSNTTENVVEAVSTGITQISDGISTFFENSVNSISRTPVRMINFTRYTISSVKKFSEEIPVEEVKIGLTTMIMAPATLAMQYSISTRGVLLNIKNMRDIWATVIGLLHGLLTSLGLRKRRRYWGTVYDSTNKQGIDPAIVELIDSNTGKVVEKSVTDLFGRFGFLDRLGTYTIRSSKTHYKFPSEFVTGYTDAPFDNVYHGEKFEIRDLKDVIAPNIPMDPVAKDWNQEEKARQGVGRLNVRFELFFTFILKVLFWGGFVLMFVLLVIKPSVVNIIFMVVYLLLAWINKYIPDPRLSGSVVSSKYPTENLLLELRYQSMPSVIVAKTVTDKNGRFFLKCAPGKYALLIKSIGDSENILIKEMKVNVGDEMILNRVIEI